MITFDCTLLTDKKQKWVSRITYLKEYKNHVEIRIESRSSLLVIFGITSLGLFACVPDFDVGCHLSYLNDKFYNTEKLISVLGEVDGITVANALYATSDVISF